MIHEVEFKYLHSFENRVIVATNLTILEELENNFSQLWFGLTDIAEGLIYQINYDLNVIYIVQSKLFDLFL